MINTIIKFIMSKISTVQVNKNYRLPPRADNNTTTRGPAETTKTRLTSVRANSKFIKEKIFIKKNKKWLLIFLYYS